MAGQLDLEEINRVRAGLGLPLLPTGSNSQPSTNSTGLNFKPSESADPDDDPGSTLESRQGEAGSNWEKWNADKVEKKRREAQREKLRKERERAQRNAKLEGKGLADDDEDEDATSWLMGAKKRQKKIAKNREKMLQRELAERERDSQAYSEKDLAGLRVGHEFGDFDDNEAGDQILTLADADVNDSENEDTLENIDVRDREREKERKASKLRRPNYDPMAIEDSGERSILGQYDEEINGKKKKRFTLDDMGAANGNISKTNDGSRQRFSLDFHQDDTPISDYQEAKEIKIKKPKKSKKEKSKKKRTADDDDDLLPPGEDTQTNGDTMQVDEGNVTSTNGTKRSYDDTFGDEDLQATLAAQRRSTLKKEKRKKLDDFVRNLREEGSATPMETNEDDQQEEAERAFVLDETSEFVANLGKERSESPDPRQRVKREDSPDVRMEGGYDSLDDEDERTDRHNYRDTPDSDLKRETSTPAAEGRTTLTSTGLDAEDHIEQGLGSTLKMLTQRGLYERGEANSNQKERERNRFLFEKTMREKRAEDVARAQRERERQSTHYKQMSNREREAAAQQANQARDQRDSRLMAETFNREYKPIVDIKYVDEYGRRMDQKAAFKHLSHQFHGKGSGKGKTEKRLQKITQEHNRDSKSSLDSSGPGMEGALAGSSRNKGAGVRMQ